MILTRLFLNALNRDVQRCMGDSHALHARVLSMFDFQASAQPRKEVGVLHRLDVSEREGTVALLLQSKLTPDAARLPSGFLDPRAGADAVATTSLETIHARLREGASFRFRLRANPTRKIDTKTQVEGIRRNGKRVPVRGDDGRLAWVERKLAAGGFAIDLASVQITPGGRSTGRRDGKPLVHEAFTFDGICTVRDPVRAWETVVSGVGPAKAFGFGLLSLAARAE